jgi:hypothetical protein
VHWGIGNPCMSKINATLSLQLKMSTPA